MAGAKLGEASRDWPLSILLRFGHADDLCRYDLPVLCLLKLKIEWKCEDFFFSLPIADKESEQHRDRLGLGGHLP
ncbi:hypothetical protein PSY52_22630, partial [Shigella flexneri]|nr:hypothetical protein [Shigella flexneri]